MLFCKVILLNNSQSFSNQADNSLTYSVPDELCDMIKIGFFVFVPILNKVETGLVSEILNDEVVADFKIKEIIDIIDPQIHLKKDLIDLIKSTGEYYATPYSQVLSTVISSSHIPNAEKEILFLKTSETDNHREILNRTSISYEVLEKLKNCRGQKAKFNRLKAVCKLATNKLNAALAKLLAEGFIEIKYHYDINLKKEDESKNYLEKFEDNFSSDSFNHLSAEQADVYKIMNKSLPELRKFLIHGVTGSGKTEVYFQLITDTLKQGKSTIVLVPEISLAPQLIDRLKQRFPNEKILIWHSALDDKEKLYSFMQLMKGGAAIVVGARSAVFSPVNNLGLIIMDEEHESSYKQDQPAPRYHTRHIAEKRADMNNAILILGSATPSAESYYQALNYSDSWKLLKLKQRFNQNPLPKVEIVDMKEEFNQGNKSIFSKKLKDLIEDRLGKGEASILFLNKRGNSSHVFCRNCGHIYKCSHCDSKMVYHSDTHLLICHLCNHTEQHPNSCPACGSNSIKYFGLGTQKLEEEVRKAFPTAKIARLDSDTTKVKNHHFHIFQKLKNREIDILIGTQMVAKGLDNPLITCVGVIAADSCFTQLDYLAEEKGFQLLTQVAGRAGRKDREGKVIFQSYLNTRPSLLLAQDQDYEKFYAEEINLRQEFNYPPFSKLIRFISSSENEVLAINNINHFHELLYEKFIAEAPDKALVQILGPSQCQINRINKQFRYHILCKISLGSSTSENPAEKKNGTVAEENRNIESEIKKLFLSYKAAHKTRLVIDVDSMSLV